MVAGTMPHKYESFGVVLAILGCGFMIMDPEAARKGMQGSALIPGIVDMISAFFGALYFIMSAANVRAIPMCLLLLIYNSHVWLLNSSLAKV